MATLSDKNFDYALLYSAHQAQRFAPIQNHRKAAMLSPHEIATLMVLRDVPARLDIELDEMTALLQLELVVVDTPFSGLPSPRLTERGSAMLLAFARRQVGNAALIAQSE